MKKNFDEIEGIYGYLIGIIAFQIASLVIGFLLIALNLYDTLEENTLLNALANILGECAFLIPVFYYAKGKDFKSAMKLDKKPKLKIAVLCVLISVVAIFSFTSMSNLFTYFLDKIGFNTDIGNSIKLDTFADLLLMIVAIGFVPAICEEFFIRGLCFNGISAKNKKLAIIVSAFMFMFMHMSFLQSFYQLFLGFMFAYILYLTDNIYYTIIMHGFNNTFVIIISYITKHISTTETTLEEMFNSPSSFVQPFVILAVGLTIIFFLVKALKMMLNEENTTGNLNLEPTNENMVDNTENTVKTTETNDETVAVTLTPEVNAENEMAKFKNKMFWKSFILTTVVTLVLYAFYNFIQF